MAVKLINNIQILDLITINIANARLKNGADIIYFRNHLSRELRGLSFL